MPLEYVNHLGMQIPIAGSDCLADEIIPSALASHQPLSIVRMSDGEEKILDYCLRQEADRPMLAFSQEWRVRFGVEGIRCGEMEKRLRAAASECTYYAPDGGEEFFLKYFKARLPFAEIYFPHRWTRKQRIALLQAAGSVLVVNRDPKVAARISGHFNPGVDVATIPLDNWRDSDRVVEEASRFTTPLVLVSAGPGSKHIIPRIAQQGKVVLDMGSGAPHFWCTRTQHVCGSPQHCGAVAKEQ